MENREQQGKKRFGGILVGAVLCLLLALFLLITTNPFFDDNPKAPTVPQAEGAEEGTTEETKPKELSITELLQAVVTLKDDLETALDDVQNGDTELAKQKIDGLSQKTATISLSLDKTKKALGNGMPSLQDQLTNIQGLLDVVDVASEKLLQPLIQELTIHPISGLDAGDGIDTSLICQYLDFFEERMPDIEGIVVQAESLDLSLIDSEGKIVKYLHRVKELLQLFRQDTSIFDRLKSFLGADGDRVYVLAAQNSSEIRASGGFPGAVGTVRIKDGILSLGDFKKVYDVFSSYTPAEANITTVENNLFHGGLSAPRDADFCPDFERVAYIWALGYEAGMHEKVDGVISMTPVIVQRLLKALDEEIVLFDGTVVNGDNAVRALQYDLYYKYFGQEYIAERWVVSDQLFADAAKKTGQKLTENMDMEDMAAYVSVILESFEDRTMMVWSKDEVLQNAIVKLGWSGGLNKDPQKPQLGVYFNCTTASKMGWFLVTNVELGEETRNEDGSYTYDAVVKISNDMTAEELKSAGWGITGGNNGGIGGSAYFFAPAGGSVSGFSTSNGSKIELNEYHDLQLGYLRSFDIYPGKTVEVTFQVTTAPGVDAPLTISQTPTVQDYH